MILYVHHVVYYNNDEYRYINYYLIFYFFTH